MIPALLFQLHMAISAENVDPVLLINLPGASPTAVEVIFPEHIAVRKRGSNAAEHLYLHRQNPKRPRWEHHGHTFQYERGLTNNIHMLARAMLEKDGVFVVVRDAVAHFDAVRRPCCRSFGDH